MKVGVSSWAFRWAVGSPDAPPTRPLDAVGLLEKAADLGAEVVQVCDNVPIDLLDQEQLGRLSSRAEMLGLELELGVRGASPERLRGEIESARKLRVRLLRVVLGEHGGQPPSLEEHLDVVRALLPDLRRSGVTLAIENHFGLTPQELARLVETIDDPLVGICLDPLNSISRLVGPRETVRLLAPHAVSIHAKDAVVRRQQTGFYVAGCPLGEGLVDIGGMLEEVRRAGRSPNVLVEAWMDPRQDEAATLAAEESMVRDGIAYLKGLAGTAAPARGRTR